MRWVSERYPQLYVHDARVRFVDGVAEVTSERAAQLLGRLGHIGVRPAEPPAGPPAEAAVDPAPGPGHDSIPDPGSGQAGDVDVDGDLAVPAGTVAEVLAWVGGDPARAARALDVERARPSPRSSLVDQLTPLAGQNGP